jgi:hypothetical protein
LINILILFSTYAGTGLFILKFLRFSKSNWQKHLGESFFIGVLVIVSINNLSQLLGLNLNQMYFFNTVMIFSILVLLISLFQIIKFDSSIFKSFNIKNLDYLHISILILVLFHLFFIFQQNNLLPLTPWDAWSAWVAKSKIWYAFGLDQLIVNQADWFEISGSLMNHTAHYPDGLSLIYFFNTGFFGWNEPALNAIYPAMFIAFLLLFYGHLKILTDKKHAIVALAILVTLPLINVHIVMAGYADIWVAVLLFTVVLNLQNYILDKELSSLIVASFFMLLLIMFKLEAMIWVLIVVMSCSLSVVEKSKRRLAYLIISSLLILWYLIGGIQINLPFGELIIAPHLIALPGLDPIPLNFISTMPAWFEAMFLSENWNLLWYSLPVVIWMQLKISNKQLLTLPIIFHVLSLIFVFILFNMTVASSFANSFTSINRIIMHLVPIYIYFLILVVYQYRLQEREALLSNK